MPGVVDMFGVKAATAALLALTVATAVARAPSIAPPRFDPPADPRSGFEPDALQWVRLSNITASDARSTIAPALPTPSVPDNAGPHEFAGAAHNALVAGHAREAQVALEQAETRLLTRDGPPDQVYVSNDNSMVSRIMGALEALGHGDRARAIQAVDFASAS